MDINRFDRMTKAIPTGTRRNAVRFLASLPAAGVLAGLLVQADQSASAKGSKAGAAGNRSKRRRRRDGGKKRGSKRASPPLTCDQACGATCQFCLTRADAPPLCAEKIESDCNRPCASDNDCLGGDVPSNRSYCATSITVLQTGQVVPPQCPTAGGKCTAASACIP